MAITLDGITGITASGNITGNYILGNGSQLSGIITSVSSLSNGSSNVDVAVSNESNSSTMIMMRCLLIKMHDE